MKVAMRGRHTVIPIFLMALLAVPACAQSSFDARRAALVDEIERDVRETRDYTGRASLDRSVMAAMAAVPRHEFVPVELADLAYENRPLPIGEGQTISQPYIVALMTDLAGVGPESKVLEVGTGSGYQAAVLAGIVDHVYTIEIVESLGLRAAGTLGRLGYENVTVRVGDGYQGWPELAPFDAILVTAAPEAIPPRLVEQLAVGGRLVVPVGAQDRAQSLQVLEKGPDGAITTRDVLPVVFVPLTRED
jgi:protein-L-isoaspartate(D-aspartate) O-methyltransferase